MAVAAALFGISQLLVNALTTVHRARLASLVELVGVAVSVVAYVVLIDAFGALGAAYGSLLGYAACLALAAVLLPRALRRRPAPSVAVGRHTGGAREGDDGNDDEGDDAQEPR
jgi:O-antigen/teichoic acid export membrane protein